MANVHLMKSLIRTSIRTTKKHFSKSSIGKQRQHDDAAALECANLLLRKRKECTFKLSEDFVRTYKSETPPFGFNGLGELVYMRA